MESIDVEHSSAQVWYLDWGFSDLVDLRSLLLFPDEVWQYLPRALPCQLLADEISGMKPCTVHASREIPEVTLYDCLG